MTVSSPAKSWQDRTIDWHEEQVTTAPDKAFIQRRCASATCSLFHNSSQQILSIVSVSVPVQSRGGGNEKQTQWSSTALPNIFKSLNGNTCQNEMKTSKNYLRKH